MNHIKKNTARFAVLLIATMSLFPTIAFAKTDGSEIQITDQPDRLIIQFGPQWAGVEFELKTDAGLFPVPVVVDASGILKMDLGGSKTYTLSCLASPVEIPEPQTEPDTAAPPPVPTQENAKPVTEPDNKSGIPTGHLILFLVGLAIAVGGLLAMRYFKRGRESYDYGDDDDYNGGAAN
jgi:hypothetical protein